MSEIPTYNKKKNKADGKRPKRSELSAERPSLIQNSSGKPYDEKWLDQEIGKDDDVHIQYKEADEKGRFK